MSVESNGGWNPSLCQNPSCGHDRKQHSLYDVRACSVCVCRGFVSACICPSKASNEGACPVHDELGRVR